MTRELSPDTLAVTAGRPSDDPGAGVNPGIELSSTFVGGAGHGYGRVGNDTWSALEGALAALEASADCITFASGQAAAAAVLAQVPAGGVVVIPDVVYNGVRAQCAALSARGVIDTRIVPCGDLEALGEAADGAALIWLETPANPTLAMTDIEAAAGIARRVGALSVCDSTFATPLGQSPLALGVDIVLHSATKYISGHSDAILGALMTDAGHGEQLRAARTLGGGIPGPFEAWLGLRGLRTLPLRWRQANQTAELLASRLQGHPAISAVHALCLPEDPGHALARKQMRSFGSVLSIELPTVERAEALCAATELWTHATSLGGVESLIERRRKWPAESPVVPETLVRLSVGIEDAEDLWADLDQALRRTLQG